MKHAFDGLISRLATAEERIFELEDLSIETIKTEKWREQSGKNKQINKQTNKQKQNRTSKDCGITTKGVTCIMGIPEGEERNRINIWNINTENFPKLMADTKPQIQEPQRMPSRISAKTLHPGI